jgi:hypothetical protein
MAPASGSLYLGRLLDPASSEPTGETLQLPSHNLTTHGVIVGMTGSGKTGLGVVLLEEVLVRGPGPHPGSNRGHGESPSQLPLFPP